ncbi:hypothetical protein A2U01_0082873, partial [Trifolium medium]|nr:hypothetical protein [Trifolium medium]
KKRASPREKSHERERSCTAATVASGRIHVGDGGGEVRVGGLVHGGGSSEIAVVVFKFLFSFSVSFLFCSS